MTEIMPVPRNLNFAVLPAGSLRSPFYRIGSQSQRKKERIPSISAQNPYIWQVASIRIFCLSRFRHQSVEVTLIIFVLNDIDRFFRCQQLV